MPDLFELAKWTHASFGAVCLLAGTAALLVRKAPGTHPKAGRVFAVTLMLAVAAILPNVLRDLNVFMLGMGALAAYTGLEGWRALRRYRGDLGAEATTADYLLQGTTALFSALLVAFGFWALYPSGYPMGVVCIGFGSLGLYLVNLARKRWGTSVPRSGWLAIHIGMMTGAFGAALTAFVAVQLSGRVGSYEWVVWVLPSIVMVTYGQSQIRRIAG